MRKAQKKQAEGFVNILGEAHEEIKRAMEHKNYAMAMDLLEQCQQGAAALGDLIEKTEGQGFGLISILEDYCEQIFKLYTYAADGQTKNVSKELKILRKLYIQIENGVRNDIKERIEAVFLPYQASMWDSLESVWRAFDEDPGCDTYVIPIPYYDRNPDGSFCKEHYEGERFPDYVPITRYDEFNFEARRPDMIFIHNPYDEYNYVTSVHPSFYSKKLKQYTDKLVYIPYFILNEIDPNNKEAVEKIKHFCTTPGVIHADKVIVQSKAMRQIYVNVLTEHTGEQTRQYWENKIDGTGSPKIDKVLRTRREELQIPEQWLKIMQKKDKSWKKIVLYNTSVNALLKHDKKMIEKMKQVFELFKSKSGEIALLWRPHPLIRATIESMRPRLWQEYKNLMENYRDEGWGIYDDSPDLNRAVCMCDVYYGDESSLVCLCKNAGKLVLLQSVEE